MKRAVPMVCVVCKHTEGNYYGRLVFPQELEGGVAPECPNHQGSDLKFPLTPVGRVTKKVS